MTDFKTRKQDQSIEAIQYKILEEISTSKEVQGQLVEELQAVYEQMINSFENEKKLLSMVHQQKLKINELASENESQTKQITELNDTVEKQSRAIQQMENTKAMQLTYKYRNLLKKLGRKGK